MNNNKGGEKRIEIGTESVVIEKLFGPTIFADLRITPDLERGWVIERKRIDSGSWEEQTIIPAQLADESDDDA